MTDPLEARWRWEETDPDRSGSSGDLAKLFKNESVKNPGVFASAAPSEHATLMAREVIQNSSDAATELSDELGESAPEFEIAFEFDSLADGAKDSFVRALDLAAIAARGTNAADPSWRSRLGLDVESILTAVSEALRESVAIGRLLVLLALVVVKTPPFGLLAFAFPGHGPLC